MSASIINSVSAPTDVDALPQLQSDAAWTYGKIWRNRLPCAQLQLSTFPQFSATRSMGELQHRTTLPAAVLTQESLVTLITIPNPESHAATVNKFKDTNNEGGLWISIGSAFVPLRISGEIDYIL
ncbi:hypothetical protein BGX30_003205 [Mortierella sp. GBA39]|nr:hypothetical protein BGX30_003205 [Mortierella sp. GBA39]